MSIIVDSVIICPFEDPDAICQVNSYLLEWDKSGQEYVMMPNHESGGFKVSSMTVYQACFNHMLLENLVNAFMTARFRRRDSLLVVDHELTGYHVYLYGQDKPVVNREMIYY